MVMTETDEKNYKKANQCWICEKPFYDDRNHRKVRDHCHFTGKYHGTAHSECNLKLSVKSDKTFIPSCRL